MLFPSTYHAFVAVKGSARDARLRPGGRLLHAFILYGQAEDYLGDKPGLTDPTDER